MKTIQATSQQLRSFGHLISSAITFWSLVYVWRNDISLLSLWPIYSITAILFAVSAMHPVWLKGIYRYWIGAAHILNRVITGFSLSVTFFVIITPLALIKRTLGRDALHSSQTLPDSYRQPSVATKPEEMEQPF